MATIQGRPDHIEDYLVSLHTGQWFGWSDTKNKVYANLIIHDDSKSKPSESDCTSGLATLQSAYDNVEYKRTRAVAYPKLKEQLDLLYKDMAADKGDKTGEWFKAVKKVKDDNPKE
jgi:hypothetical protein